MPRNDCESMVGTSVRTVELGGERVTVVRLYETDIVFVWPNGRLLLNTGNFFTKMTMRRMEQHLKRLGISAGVGQHTERSGARKGEIIWTLYDRRTDKQYEFVGPLVFLPGKGDTFYGDNNPVDNLLALGLPVPPVTIGPVYKGLEFRNGK